MIRVHVEAGKSISSVMERINVETMKYILKRDMFHVCIMVLVMVKVFKSQLQS